MPTRFEMHPPSLLDPIAMCSLRPPQLPSPTTSFAVVHSSPPSRRVLTQGSLKIWTEHSCLYIFYWNYMVWCHLLWGWIVRTRTVKFTSISFWDVTSVLSISLVFHVLLHSTPLLRTLDFLSLLTWARKPRLDSNCRTHKMLSHFCVKLL